jgi:polar amino acid transport system substrate-binding protein
MNNFKRTVISLWLLTMPLSVFASTNHIACTALQHKYPEFVGKTLVQALTPYTPGYESIDPKDPSKYIGFDIDLAKAIGNCLGFKVAYKPVAFDALLSTLDAGHANFVMSDIYATKQRAKAANFITYGKVYDGTLVAKGNPLRITGINTTLCGHTVAENTGFVEVPLVDAVKPKCLAIHKAPPHVLLFNNNADCFEAVLNGRANAYFNDANTVDHAAAKNPTKLMNAGNLKLPYSLGIGIPKNNKTELSAFKSALIVTQKAGIEKKLLKKWGFPTYLQENPRVVTSK